MKQQAWVLIAGWMILGNAFASADQSVQFVESYAGPHQQEFRDLFSQVQMMVPSALAFVTGRWGLPNSLQSPLVVRVTDSAMLKIPGRPVSAYVRSIQTSEGLRQELVVDLTHHLMYPGENLENVLYHEMAHVVLQDASAGPSRAGLPQWFNEGLAQTVTTEGRERTEEDFKRYGHSDAHAVLCDLNGNIDAFYHGEYNFGCYTQFYLAVQRYLDRGGHDAIARTMGGLRQGLSLPQIVPQVTNMSWDDFQKDVAQCTRDVFAGNKPIP